MDSCEVIYLSKIAQRASDQGKLSACAAVPEGHASQPAAERADTKVVSLQAWAAAHRPDHP